MLDVKRMTGPPLGRIVAEETLTFGVEPSIGLIEVGGKSAFCCLTFLVSVIPHHQYLR
jgi:hypothetical protein